MQLPAKVNSTLDKIKPHGPTIGLVVGIGGMATSLYLAWRNAPIAQENIKRRKKKEKRDLTIGEYVQEVWKPVAPSVGLFAASAITIGLSHKENLKRIEENAKQIATYATAAKVSEAALKEFQEKTKEIAGPKKLEQIKEKIIEDNLNTAYPDSLPSTMLPVGMQWFMEPYTKVIFPCNFDKFGKGVTELNKLIANEMGGTVADLLDILGVSSDEIPESAYDAGWNSLDYVTWNETAALWKGQISVLSVKYDNPPSPSYALDLHG